MNELRREIEEAIIGAILLEKGAYPQVSDFLLPVNFKDPLHREIYKVVSKMYSLSPIDIDRITVNYKTGGKYAYDLFRLTSWVSSAEHILSHGECLLDLCVRESFNELLTKILLRETDRTILSLVQDIKDMAEDYGEDILYIITKAQVDLEQIGKAKSIAIEIADFDNKIDQRVRQIKNLSQTKALLKHLKLRSAQPADTKKRLAASILFDATLEMCSFEKTREELVNALINLPVN